MYKQKSKKLNSHQKLIAAISLLVAFLLVVCVTFAWYTNKIDVLRSKFTLGRYAYTVTVYDVPVTVSDASVTSVGNLSQVGTRNYTNEDSDSWINHYEVEGDNSFVVDSNNSNWASESVVYQVVKVHNTSGFAIKAYEYLKYSDSLSAKQELLANNFYFKAVKLNYTGNDVGSFLQSNPSVFPKPTSANGGIAAYNSIDNFSNLKNNSVQLGAGSIGNNQTAYYLVGYCVNGLSEQQLQELHGEEFEVIPVLAIGQSNAPNPVANAVATVYHVSDWDAFLRKINEAGDGDTIYLDADIEGVDNKNLVIDRNINLNLNGYNLTIHGSLNYTCTTGDTRTLTVPSSSILTIDGDLHISSIGPFKIAGASGSTNIRLGKLGTATVNNAQQTIVKGGEFKAQCGRRITEGNDLLKPAGVNENSGLVLDGVAIQKIKTDGTYENANLSLTRSKMAVALKNSAAIGTVAPASNRITDVYIINRGVIGNLNLADIDLEHKEDPVGIYVMNYNTVNGLSLPSDAYGYQSDSSSDKENYNVRLYESINAATSFKNYIVDNSGDISATKHYYLNFATTDVEPFSSGSLTSYVEEISTGVYSATIVDDNSGTPWTISDLFAQEYGATAASHIAACTSLSIINSASYPLGAAVFTDIRDNFANLTKLDLSSAVLELDEDDFGIIPDNAFNVAAYNSTTNPGGSTSASKAEDLAEVIFPDRPITIGANAFKGTKISSISIGSNVKSIGAGAFDVNGELEVQWNSAESVADYLSAFDVNSTTIFVESAAAQAIMDLPSNVVSDTWKLNIYEQYDFISGDYYCKDVSGGCSIIYYAGTITDGMNLVPERLTKQTGSVAENLDVVGVGRQAFRKAIMSFTGETGVTIDLSGCLTVDDNAFIGSLKVNSLDLGMVNRIGKNAFRGNDIASVQRSGTFGGMVKLDANAFTNVTIASGNLELQGPSEKYSPAAGALASLITSSSVDINLSNCNAIPTGFATGAELKGDLDLRNTNTIGERAFYGVIVADSAVAPTNVIDVRDVKSIGQNAFYNIQCGTFKLGTMPGSSVYAGMSAYSSIIGNTSQRYKIGNMVIDGNFKTNQTDPAFASNIDGESVTIDCLTIAKVTDSSDNLVPTTIPKNSFASGENNDDGVLHNLIIKSLTVGYTTTVNNSDPDNPYTEYHYASYEIGDRAFYGTFFNPTDASTYLFDFQGVTRVGSLAFAESNIVRLGLGEEITEIDSENFISHCDSIQLLRIDNSSQVVILGGQSPANPAFSSGGTKLADFKIKVNGHFLPDYIGDDVWSGWKDYFDAMYHICYTNINGVFTEANAATALVYKWSFNTFKLTENNTEKSYAEIVKCEIDSSNSTYWNNDYMPYGASNLQSNGLIRMVLPNKLRDENNDEFVVLQLGVKGVSVFGDIELDDPSHTIQLNLDNATSLQEIYPPAISSENIGGFYTINSAHFQTYPGADTGMGIDSDLDAKRILYYRTDSQNTIANATKSLELVKVLPTYEGSLFYIPLQITKIQEGCFENCTSIERVILQKRSWVSSYYTSGTTHNNRDAKLEMIDQDAFKGATNITVFDFSATKQYIYLGTDALGEPRDLIVTDDGHYGYEPRTVTIVIPATTTLFNSFRDSADYYLFYKFGRLLNPTQATSAGILGSSLPASSAKTGQSTSLSLKKTEADTVLAGIQYHIMNSGTEYNGVTYSSEKSQFVAGVTGLSQSMAESATVIIPSTISVKGISYEVVAITDTAFGSNDVLSTLVLPNRELTYSSNALAGCSVLGTIQFNDVVPYEESAQTVAALPTPSLQSLLENHSDDESEE